MHKTLFQSDHDHLFSHLFGPDSGYNSKVPPLAEGNSSFDLGFGVAPIYLDMDEAGVLKGRVWLRIKWTDYRYISEVQKTVRIRSNFLLSRLAYDPAKFGGIKVIRIDPTLLWLPDVVLYNRVDSER